MEFLIGLAVCVIGFYGILFLIDFAIDARINYKIYKYKKSRLVKLEKSTLNRRKFAY